MGELRGRCIKSDMTGNLLVKNMITKVILFLKDNIVDNIMYWLTHKSQNGLEGVCRSYLKISEHSMEALKMN